MSSPQNGAAQQLALWRFLAQDTAALFIELSGEI
jgi:hypothetical protein